jgi:hypothetical protein
VHQDQGVDPLPHDLVATLLRPVGFGIAAHNLFPNARVLLVKYTG